VSMELVVGGMTARCAECDHVASELKAGRVTPKHEVQDLWAIKLQGVRNGEGEWNEAHKERSKDLGWSHY
jgi:hypothetical protein